MADTVQQPWERFTPGDVVNAPPAGPTAPPNSGAATMPWERFKQEDVVDATPYMESVAAAGEADLDAYPDFKYPVPETDSATLNFLGRAGRSTWMHATDYAEAWQLQTVFNRQKNEKDAALPDMSYGEALRHVRTGYAEADPHLVAEIAGAVVAGGPIAAGVRRGALWAATKGGLVESALRWGARHPILGRITAAAAEGGAGGAIEEGVRSAVNESLDVTGGGSFNASDVARDVAFGTLIGGIAAPSMQEALRTVGGGLRYLGGALGLGSVQSEQAASRIMREFAQPGEVADATMARLNDTVSAFVRRNGYMPSMADILPPEKVASLARVVRNVSGLDIRAAELSEEGVARALKAYDRALGMGGPATMSVEQIETGVENLFTSVVERNGKTLVDVPESALDVLTANRAWIAKIAGNAGAGSDAARVVQVLDARTSIGDLRQTFLSFNRTRNVADQRQSVADLGDQIAKLIDEQFSGSTVEASQIAMLRNLQQLQRAAAALSSATNQQGDAVFHENVARNLLMRAQSVIDDFEANGLKITLSAANDIRATASRHFYTAADPTSADTARAIRDSVAPIGVKEVPEYGEVVKRWNTEHVRAEAQATGRAAAAGNVDLGDLETRLAEGRLPGKPRAKGEGVAALRLGAEEGAVRALRQEAGASPRAAMSSAERIASNRNVQRGLEMVAPGRAPGIVAAADQARKAYNSAVALLGPRSKGLDQQEMEAAHDMLVGAMFGGIGGAAKAGLLTRLVMHLHTPRGTAKKIVEMLGNPDEIDKALTFMQRRGIRLGALFGAVTNATLHMDVE